MTAPVPDPEIQRVLAKARSALIFDHPFFGSLALRLELKVMPPEMAAAFIEREMMPTLAVDGRHVFYNERYVSSLTPDLVKSALAHEVSHCVFDHIGRRNNRDPQNWNIAGDYVVNEMLKDAGFTLGQGWLYNPAYKGKSTDEIYNLLPKGGGGGGGGGQQPQDNVMDGESDPAQKSADRTDWEIATVQAANAAKAEGKLPASISRFVEELVRPHNNWRDRLRQFVTERSRDEYDWARFNKRYLAAGVYLPALYSETMGTIVVVSDDSGSITDDILALFNGEIVSIRDAVRPQQTYVISCDARVNHVIELGPDEPMKLENHGGGGTDFRPPFQWLEKRGIKPACLVYLTDLYGSFPKNPPDYPVLWCSINDGIAPWGETIKVQA